LLPEKHQSRDAAEREKYKKNLNKNKKRPQFSLFFFTQNLDFRDSILVFFLILFLAHDCCCWVEVKNLNAFTGASKRARLQTNGRKIIDLPQGLNRPQIKLKRFGEGGRGAKQANNPLFHP
jgi:hypothetical protein